MPIVEKKALETARRNLRSELKKKDSHSWIFEEDYYLAIDPDMRE